MKDVLLNYGGDLYLSRNGDIEFTDSVSQAIRIRLLWFLGEWRINKTFGMPYYDEVYIKNPSLTLLEDRIRREILTVDEVVSVESVNVAVDANERKATVRFVALTDKETIQEEVMLDV